MINITYTKHHVYKTSRIQNIMYTKHHVYKTSRIQNITYTKRDIIYIQGVPKHGNSVTNSISSFLIIL